MVLGGLICLFFGWDYWFGFLVWVCVIFWVGCWVVVGLGCSDYRVLFGCFGLSVFVWVVEVVEVLDCVLLWCVVVCFGLGGLGWVFVFGLG